MRTALRNRLAGISGRFILLLNGHPEIWKLFAGFNIQKSH